MIRVTWTLMIAATILAAAGCAERHQPTDILLRNQWVGNIDTIDFREPSGIVYHTARGTLFVVGDEGDICEIGLDGALVRRMTVTGSRIDYEGVPAGTAAAQEFADLQSHKGADPGTLITFGDWDDGEMFVVGPDGTLLRKSSNRGVRIDYEGITVDPATGLLYIAIEGEEVIVQIDPDSLETLRRFQLDRSFDGAVIMDPKGQGIEGITFVPDAGHPEGGTFYVSNQAFDPDNPTDISAILEIELPLRTATGDAPARTLRVMRMPIIDLAGLHYDAASRRILVASDATNTLWVVTLDGRVERGYALIGASQEGITLDGDGHLYIAQDEGGVIKVRWRRP